MAKNSTTLEIIEPSKSLFAGEVDMVVIPGSEGDFGVLPGCAPFMSALRLGSIVVFDHGKAIDRFFVSGGFVEISGSICRVLADSACQFDSVQLEEIEKRCANARDSLSSARDDQERQKAEHALNVAEELLNAYQNPVYIS